MLSCEFELPPVLAARRATDVPVLPDVVAPAVLFLVPLLPVAFLAIYFS
jgi:hypothetical protein